MKIITILGARPQFVKAGNVSREIAKYKEIKEIIVHTGQHFDANMSDIFFEEMQIPKPDYFLDINGLGHGAMTGQMLEKIEEVLLKEKPDWVMVYGDTNSTLAGALAASKLHIKIAHIEAGLRSFNMKMPEELNRVLTDRISDLLFCPTSTAAKNLEKEGYPFTTAAGKKQSIAIVGDVMYDGALFYKQFAQKPSTLNPPHSFTLCTVHRAENTDDPKRLRAIVSALETIAEQIPVILPLHPRTRKKLKEMSLHFDKVNVIDPVGYLQMVWLLDRCELVLTDSGGLQKEAYFFKKPCVTLRDETEWIELVDAGVNFIAGADKKAILRAFNETRKLSKKDFSNNLYGEGNTATKIIETLKNE